MSIKDAHCNGVLIIGKLKAAFVLANRPIAPHIRIFALGVDQVASDKVLNWRDFIDGVVRELLAVGVRLCRLERDWMALGVLVCTPNDEGVVVRG